MLARWREEQSKVPSRLLVIFRTEEARAEGVFGITIMRFGLLTRSSVTLESLVCVSLKLVQGP